MSYPTSIDAPGGTAAQGTSLLSSIDHALDHRTLGSAVIAIETKIGIGSGTPTAGAYLQGTSNGSSFWGTNLTFNNVTIGTPSITGGTYNNGVFGTPSLTGGTYTSPLISGGTANSQFLGTPTLALIGSVSGSDTRINSDTAGTKVLTFTSVRQGGTVTDWSAGGTTAFPVANVFIQSGALVMGDTTNHTVTFPVAFSKAPVVTCSIINSSGCTLVIKSIGATNFVAAQGATADATSVMTWIAIGER